MQSYPQKLRRPTPTLLACALASCLLMSSPSVLAQSTAATGLKRTVQVGSNGG